MSTVLLRRSGSEVRITDRGPVPPGRWMVWADFGQGLVVAGNLDVIEGANLTLRCDALFTQCDVHAPR